MTRPLSPPSRSGRTDNIRVRAAWMYYIEQRTQSEIADLLKIGRVTVVRLLAEARDRHEVKVVIESELAELVFLERELETRLGLEQAIVAPAADANDTYSAISAATGAYLSETVQSGQRIGVGWGRTLYGSLPYITQRTLENFEVISLLGGIIEARRFNPSEFAWQFAQLFRGDAWLVPAPAIVDCEATKNALVNHCGLDSLFDRAASLDMALLSVGALTPDTTSHQVGLISLAEYDELIAARAVGDVLTNFIDAEGALVDHPINRRSISVGLERILSARHRVVASGGPEKIVAMRAAFHAVQPHVLITDEHTARQLLAG